MDGTRNILHRFLVLGALGGFIKYIGKRTFKCEQCERVAKTDQYSYQNAQYIPDHIPKVWKALCGKCFKREIGKKRYKQFLLGEGT